MVTCDETREALILLQFLYTYTRITHEMVHFSYTHTILARILHAFESGLASAIGGCMRSIHEYIHRLGISIVNHKGNCLHIYE